MGDRANVHVTDGKGDGVYLYTHWRGDELPLEVKAALSKHWRWNDAQYLTRIIFDTMAAGCHGEETGFGISSRLQDNAHPIVRVDCEKNQIAFVPEQRHDEGGLDLAAKPLKVWSFTDFIAATDKAILKVYEND